MNHLCVFFFLVKISKVKVLDKHENNLEGWLPLYLFILNFQVSFEK